MNDHLFIRFPGKEEEHFTGEFIAVANESPLNGYVFVDFSGRHRFQFHQEEKTPVKQWHFGSTAPYVVTPREYYLQAHEMLNGINLMQLGKVVYSRVKQVKRPQLPLEKWFKALCDAYPKACVYLVSAARFGTWIGASPEMLLEAHHGHGFTVALAGTKASNETRDWSDKEREEQHLVTEFITEILEQQGAKDIESLGPYDSSAGPVTHLKTDFNFSTEHCDVLSLINTLHPTPAVSAFPRAEGLTLIESIEPHQRALYAGYFGFISKEKTKLFVNLRCAQVQEEQLFLYLGGGYTRESIPEQEWIETENKAKTLLNVLK